MIKFQNIALEYGLRLNRKKCCLLAVNDKETHKEVENLKPMSEIMYLGVKINNGKSEFKAQNEEMIKKGNRMFGVIYSILGRSCNRLLIGKTFWKNMALPNILYGSEAICLNKNTLDKLQVIENKAYRAILQLPQYTPSEFLRGEIGASSVYSRDIKSKLLYLQSILKSNANTLLKNIIVKELEVSELKWIKTVQRYLNEAGLNLENLKEYSANQIRRVINDKDTREWRESMENKSSLLIYRSFKVQIEEIKWFRNGGKWSIMIAARANTLRLGWREWELEEGKICKLCREENETLEHFLIVCCELQETRSKYCELQMPRIENNNIIIGEILMLTNNHNGEDSQYFVNMLWDLWNMRSKAIKSIELNLLNDPSD